MRDRTGPQLAAALALLFLAAFAGADASVKEQVLATVPPGAKIRDPSFSADYRRCAYLLLKSKTDKRAVVDGKEGPAFEFISGVVFSPDGTRWAHAGIRGSKQYMVVDGREEGPFERVGTEPHFSPDGRHVAYYAKSGPDQFMVTDGKRGPAFDQIRGTDWQPDFSISDDGSRLAFAARKGKKWFTVIDGVPGEAYDEVSQLTGFSPDGRHSISLGRRGTARWAVVDGRPREIGRYDIAALPSISPDGKHIAFFAKRAGQVFIVLDGKESEPKEGAGGVQFVPGDDRMVYLSFVHGKRVIIDGDRVGGPYDYVDYPAISPDGREVAYEIVDGAHSYPVINGRRGTAFDPRAISRFRFSPDGAHIAFLGMRFGRALLVVDGREIPIPAFPEGNDWKPRFAFSPKGDEILMAFRIGRNLVRAAFAVPQA